MKELGVWLQNVHKEDLNPTEIIKCECDPDCGRLVYPPTSPKLWTRKGLIRAQYIWPSKCSFLERDTRMLKIVMYHSVPHTVEQIVCSGQIATTCQGVKLTPLERDWLSHSCYPLIHTGSGAERAQQDGAAQSRSFTSCLVRRRRPRWWWGGGKREEALSVHMSPHKQKYGVRMCGSGKYVCVRTCVLNVRLCGAYVHRSVDV